MVERGPRQAWRKPRSSAGTGVEQERDYASTMRLDAHAGAQCPRDHRAAATCQCSPWRLGWITPVLVNAAQAFDAVKTKSYVVR